MVCPLTLAFHNYQHTEEVVEALWEIGANTRLRTDEMEVVLIAGWFHDVGYCAKYRGHEDESKRRALAFLSWNDYPEEKTEKVLACIEATRFPQRPGSRLEEVLCDADLYHLSALYYLFKANLLRQEWEHHRHQVFTEEEWAKHNLRFLLRHAYFTPYGRKELRQGKERNISSIRSSLEAG